MTRLVKRLADGVIADGHGGGERRVRAADLARFDDELLAQRQELGIALDVGDDGEHLLGGEGNAPRRLEGGQGRLRCAQECAARRAACSFAKSSPA